jgi:thiol:disulfide interchange protein DsbC
MKRFGLILFFIFTVFLFLTFTSIFAYSFSNGGCEGDCKKCHSLSTQEVNGILKKMNLSRAKILNIQLSPVKSLWEVFIDDNGKKGIFYVDFSKKYLLSGQIIEVDTGSNKTAESAQRIPIGKADVSKIPINNALVMGNARAPKKVIVFTDPD